jgi:hypothetical protein
MGPGMMGQGMGPGMMGQGTGPGMPMQPGQMPGMGPGMMGQDMGPGMMGQGMGPGMTGQGMMGQDMGPAMMGHGMGPGMMGQGMMGQDMGPAMGPRTGFGLEGRRVVPMVQLSTDDVRVFFERHLAALGNERLKVGKVEAVDDNTISADIVTVDDSLVESFEVDRHTGLISAAG